MKVTIEGILQEVVSTKQGKSHGSIINFVIAREGTINQKYMLTAFADDETEGEITALVGEEVKAECYLNGKQFVNGEKKFYNELKLIKFN